MKDTVNRVFLVLLSLGLLLVPILTLLRWQDGASFYEQRMLTSAPQLTGDGLWTGSFFEEAEQSLSDHIVARDLILRTDTALDLAAGRPKVNDLVVNSDTLLSVNGYFRWDLSYLPQEAGKAARRYASLSALVESLGGKFYYVGAPLQFTYFSDHYPSYMENRTWCTDPIRTAFSDAMAQEDVSFLNLYAVFEEQGHPEDFYYRTDHHFTLKGAFSAYEALMARIEQDTKLTPLERADFTWTTLPNPFLGSSNRKLYGLWPNDDRLEVAVPCRNIPFTRTDNGAAVESSVLTLPANDAAQVSYTAYMGGDIGETVIETNRPELPSLLLYGDSFTNPLETLLWANFDETRCLDFRYYDEKTLGEYLETYRPDIVVCVRDESVFLSETDNGAWQ